MTGAALLLTALGVLGCAADGREAAPPPLDFTGSWSAAPVDSVTVEVSAAEAVPDAEELGFVRARPRTTAALRQ